MPKPALLLSALLVVTAVASAADLPLELTLTSHRAHYVVDRGGKSADDYIASLKKGSAPYGPAVALMVEVKNTGDKDLIAYGAPRPQFILKGPRAESVCDVVPTQFQAAPSRRYTIAAGKSVFLNVISFFNPARDEPNVKDTVKRLSYSDGTALHCVNWTEPGEYTLSAVLELGLSPGPAGGRPFDKSKFAFNKVPADLGVVRLESKPITLTIREGNDTAYWSEALDDADAEVRFVAAHTLTAAIPLAEATRLKMAARLQDTDARVRKSAARALQRPTGSTPAGSDEQDSAVVALTKALKDTNPGVRNFAVTALATWGQTVKTSAPAMLPLLNDSDAGVRLACAEALGELFCNGAPEDHAVAQACIAALNDADERVVYAATIDLGKLKAPEAVEALIPLCKAKSAALSQAAIEAIGSIGVDANAAEETLFAALKSNDTRAPAATALGKIKADPAKLFPALAEALKTETDPFGRVAIVRALGTCGAPGTAKLLDILKTDKDSTVKEFAAGSLAKMGPLGKEALPALIAALSDANDDVQCNVADVLGNMGHEAHSAVQSLAKLTIDSSPAVRAHAQSALQKIGGK